TECLGVLGDNCQRVLHVRHQFEHRGAVGNGVLAVVTNLSNSADVLLSRCNLSHVPQKLSSLAAGKSGERHELGGTLGPGGNVSLSGQLLAPPTSRRSFLSSHGADLLLLLRTNKTGVEPPPQAGPHSPREGAASGINPAGLESPGRPCTNASGQCFRCPSAPSRGA